MPKYVLREWQGVVVSENGLECGRFQWKSMGGLLESDAIRERKNMAAELEDTRR